MLLVCHQQGLWGENAIVSPPHQCLVALQEAVCSLAKQLNPRKV